MYTVCMYITVYEHELCVLKFDLLQSKTALILQLAALELQRF